MLFPLRLYDYLSISRARVLACASKLDEESYWREFPIGPGSVGKTLTHMLVAEWYYAKRMQGADVAPYEQWTLKDETRQTLSELQAAWEVQAAETKRVIRDVRDWQDKLSYEVTSDTGERHRIRASPADQFSQLFEHEVHHRAQVMNMLRQLGQSVGDVDYNMTMYERETF